jgi:hypothetical protein
MAVEPRQYWLLDAASAVKVMAMIQLDQRASTLRSLAEDPTDSSIAVAGREGFVRLLWATNIQ